jgi:hypothetical protein
MADKKWDALVWGDYEAVMPLVWGKKLGFKFLYQPFFCQQLGVFSKTKLSENTNKTENWVSTDDFIKAIPSQFRYWDFHLNYWNKYYSPSINFINRTSYSIDLNDNYIDIYDKYSSDAKKNLAKLSLKNFVVKSDSVEVAAKSFFDSYGQHYKNAELWKTRIVACAKEAIALNKGFVRSIYGPDHELWCSGFFFKAKNRIHYAMAAPTEIGKKNGATHALIDEVIKEFSNSNLIFDFEGSDIQSVAYFYSKFGSVKNHYLEIINNNMPWYIKLFKS